MREISCVGGEMTPYWGGPSMNVRLSRGQQSHDHAMVGLAGKDIAKRPRKQDPITSPMSCMLFDLDNTLVDTAPLILRTLA